DPYLESHWGDIHHRLITYACDLMQPLLPADLRARVEERVYLEGPSGRVRSVYPDVYVVERPDAPSTAPLAGATAGSTLTLAEPMLLQVASEEVTEGFIEIREAGTDGKVITVIEFVSLSNKLPGTGRERYLKKQQECLAAGVNLVEIDLLRAGERVFAYSEDALPRDSRTPYRICTWRAARPDVFAYYPVPLREKLPAIAIPLRATDPDAPLDLQMLLDQAYRNGRYDDLDYSVEPAPPLSGDDAAWADALLRERQLRH
ncbi:MAG: DUF4058 family protein, partial [Planctomycetales bacterium]|nr:DUF4058 family protein [Planctomycetales bacterium]